MRFVTNEILGVLFCSKVYGFFEIRGENLWRCVSLGVSHVQCCCDQFALFM